MPIPEAETYIPPSNDILQAFDVVKKRHELFSRKTTTELKEIELDLLQVPLADYFTAGVAFLANRGHDNFIRDIGSTTWKSVNKQRTMVAATDNMVGAAFALGTPLKTAIEISSKNDEPHVLFMARIVGSLSLEQSYVLMPPEFIYTANQLPIQALATMSWICSQVRDMEQGRLPIDQPNFTPRGEAVEAHFLIEALRRYPQTVLSSEYQRVLRLYPEGLRSLPAEKRYNSPNLL